MPSKWFLYKLPRKANISIQRLASFSKKRRAVGNNLKLESFFNQFGCPLVLATDLNLQRCSLEMGPMEAHDPRAGPQLRAHGSGCKLYMDPTSHANKARVNDLATPNN